ncbi:RBBP8 N-terminal-like protein [Chanos chanos]|uniref:RBBP8 N-terminal-like protein n=1 Tax=Chanos chanos TaxID=29144 RepID=A0A6J2UWY3_CHACN|nr:RBBP8 N-terminal-like protein [Chanos chanos]
MAVESFNELLHKLREFHEHELEGWQVKVLELSNKRTCDAKRMEELFTRNQQLREQQRILTENIKQLENRLRAGLCDRCTVTQDVAKRRQQEYESSQLQSLQHISILASELSSLKKENEKLREELKSLRAQLERQNGHAEEEEILAAKKSPDLPSPAIALQTSTPKPGKQPPGGATSSQATARSETYQTDATESQGILSVTDLRPHASCSWIMEDRAELYQTPCKRRKEVREALSVDTLEQRLSPGSPSLSSPLRLPRSNPFSPSSSSSSSPAAGEEKHHRQQVHNPLPVRPHPIKSACVPLPWSLPEHPDWVTMATAAGEGGIVVHPQHPSHESNPNPLRLPGLIPSSHRSPGCGLAKTWPPIKVRSQCLGTDSRERRVETISWKSEQVQGERIFGEGLTDMDEDAPLDLSDSGRSRKNANNDLSSSSSSSSSSSTSTLAPLSSSSSQCPSSPQSELQAGEQNLKEAQENRDEEEDNKEEKENEGKEDQNVESSKNSDSKKVPVLTISLRPVVVLEAMKSQDKNLSYSTTALQPISNSEYQRSDMEEPA